MIEYTDIYLKKQSAEYARMCLMQYIACHYTNYCTAIKTETYSEHCQTYFDKDFVKNKKNRPDKETFRGSFS